MPLENELIEFLNTHQLTETEHLQSLWSGYGKIIRVQNNNKSYIVKVIANQTQVNHPRGWNTSTSHERKLNSYRVETEFYRQGNIYADEKCRIPALIASQHSDKGTWLLLEDLDDAGFFVRKERANWHSLRLAIRWLAYFHAKNMFTQVRELWPTGTYWQLETRQDEWQKMADSDYKSKANIIHQTLLDSPFQTLCHGDAKFENLCFHQNADDIAAVDFQYVGRGVGVKDLAYLATSCLEEDQLFEFDEQILEEYLEQLNCALEHYQIAVDFDQLEKNYRYLYPIAWADFYRFLLGWNPQSWKVNRYIEYKSQLGLRTLHGNE